MKADTECKCAVFLKVVKWTSGSVDVASNMHMQLRFYRCKLQRHSRLLFFRITAREILLNILTEENMYIFFSIEKKRDIFIAR